jgi:hypothetical protein
MLTDKEIAQAIRKKVAEINDLCQEGRAHGIEVRFSSVEAFDLNSMGDRTLLSVSLRREM